MRKSQVVGALLAVVGYAIGGAAAYSWGHHDGEKAGMQNMLNVTESFISGASAAIKEKEKSEEDTDKEKSE